MSTDTGPARTNGRGASPDGGLADALVRTRRFFTRGTVSDDLRTLTKTGGREAD